MEPSKKSPEFEEALKKFTGIDRVEAIRNDLCTGRGKPHNGFRNDISEKEYRVSGLCQECQDIVFGED